ncbi:MAG: YkgJ family cysteine cluster protein [Planctomycetes bacterium]|nr:YkgJ family cysteine cluster protein [Planctomycetota bacterium]
MAVKRVNREDLKPGEVLCQFCTAKCCRYFALPIETPTTQEDFGHLRWYMIHRRVSIFVDDETWYLMVHADCEHLQDDLRCGIYEDRPQICRDYTTDECEYDDDACYEKLFETAEQIWEYAEAVLPLRKKKRKKKRDRVSIELPVITVQ